MTPKKEERSLGEVRARRGIKRGAFQHEPEIRRDMLRFLDALLVSSTGTATLDDATDDLHGKFGDGGRWRGAIPKRLRALGIIVADVVTRSSRIARNAGYLSIWKLVDRATATRYREELVAMGAGQFEKETGGTADTVSPANEFPPTVTKEGSQDHG